MRSTVAALGLAAALAPARLAGQTWNDSLTTFVITRAVMHRASAQGSTGLRDFEARAHGLVFFLGQLGEGLAEPPKLIKADQLVLEVYWKAPGRSKQRIVGWRDRRDLPTDIQYHRDHLGIVMNGFGNRIRLGEGDEVRDVPHPLAPAALQLYQYALVDSLTIALPQRTVRVYEVRVRPKDVSAPRIIGTLYLDADESELVRMRFQFTRASYLDPSIEDITVVLDNGLWDGRYWLPRRQEIEIRRRTAWLDLPARGIIRGRWEIGDYRFNVGLSDQVFEGLEIVAAPLATRRAFAWPDSLDRAVAEAAGGGALDMREVRRAIGRLAASQVLSGLPAVRPGGASLSDFAHFNRVEGLALGGGGVIRPGGGRTEMRGWIGYGFADQRAKARLALRHIAEQGTVSIQAAREVKDVGDEPLIAPLLNSLAAQELGRDYGDYVLRDAVHLGVRRRLPGGLALQLEAGWERTQSVVSVARPVAGGFRPNADLGAGRYWVGRVGVSRRAWALPPLPEAGFDVTVEGGRGTASDYLRARAAGRLEYPVGLSAMRLDGWAGIATAALRPDRAFLWGGRGAAGCEVSVRCGGRYGAGGGVEVRVRLRIPEIPLGAFVATGRELVVAPFVRAAWLGGAVAGSPWMATDGILPVTGLAVEWMHQLLRIEAGWAPRNGAFGLTADLHRSLWSLL